MRQATIERLKKDEGFFNVVSPDSKGYPTGGHGHMDLQLTMGSPVSLSQGEAWIESDYDEAERGYGSLGLDLDPVRRAVVIMMIFNMGLPTVTKFKKMLGHLQAGDYKNAAYEGLVNTDYSGPSQWWLDVKDRAPRLMAVLLSGMWV